MTERIILKLFLKAMVESENVEKRKNWRDLSA